MRPTRQTACSSAFDLPALLESPRLASLKTKTPKSAELTEASLDGKETEIALSPLEPKQARSS